MKNKKNQIKNIIAGLFLLSISIFFFLSFLSFFFHWKNDQSQLINLFKKEIVTENLLGKIGAIIAHYFIYYGIGISSLLIPILLFITGYKILCKKKFIVDRYYQSMIYHFIFFSIWIPISFYFIIPNHGDIIIGVFGYEIGNFLVYLFGYTGSYLLIIISMIFYLIIVLSKKKIFNFFQNFKNLNSTFFSKEKKKISININNNIKKIKKKNNFYPHLKINKKNIDIQLVNEKNVELNKKKIIQILNHYQIKIFHIKSIIGPTVTLYEIYPHLGVRISKIKNLEKEIALNLSAKSIRIIAPIPGKNSIGIEIPNYRRNIIYLNDILFSEKSNKVSYNMELPISLGKTIFNENFIIDLTEMPHLLIAGSTGQGKSVELNVIITFLLHKKNPKNLKFILIDPKKVELSIYQKISPSYFAILPNGNKIITNLNETRDILYSLCKEMEKRYSILEKYKVRNIKEYHQTKFDKKFYLPYIILIIDEFADLFLSYKSVKINPIEKYIIRLSQLARAVGIHLIIATQRPSVNVISGLIKSNFTARIAFKVSSQIDSKIILDCSGAEKLTGKGDSLFSNKNELIRLQCPFIDSSDIQKIVNYYGNKFCEEKKYFLPNPKSM